MKWPNFRTNHIGRFLSTVTEATYAAFHQDYVANIRQEYLEYITTGNNMLERKKAAVTISRKRLAKAAAAVAANETKIDKQKAQMTIINAQLEKAEDNPAAAADILATLRTSTVTKEEWADDPDHADWLRNIEAKTKNDTETAATFKKEINRRFKSITKEDCKVFRSGSICNGINYANTMIQLAT